MSCYNNNNRKQNNFSHSLSPSIAVCVGLYTTVINKNIVYIVLRCGKGWTRTDNYEKLWFLQQWKRVSERVCEGEKDFAFSVIKNMLCRYV